MNKPGTLYIVGTPIGNIEDITIRALNTLKEVDGILCEDTRQTIKLLNHYEIKNKLSSYHKYNEKETLSKVMERLESGENLALVSDAGLPLISDPGSLLVKECRNRNIDIEVLPGANAALSALQLSGLNAERFTFFGFPKKRKKDQRVFMDEVLNSPNTAIVYESPHHLLKTLNYIKEKDPNRQCSISREITKKFQETINGNPETLIEYFEENPPKGEFVIVIEKSSEDPKNDYSDKSVEELFQKLTKEGLSEKEAIKQVSRLKNMKRREVYSQIKIDKN